MTETRRNVVRTDHPGAHLLTRRQMLGAAALMGAGAWLATGSGAAIAASPSIVDELSRFVADQAGRGLFSGAVLLDHRGCPAFSAAYGQADRAASVPNTPDTRFTIASVGKFLTAVTAARLVQDGRLRFSS